MPPAATEGEDEPLRRRRASVKRASWRAVAAIEKRARGLPYSLVLGARTPITREVARLQAIARGRRTARLCVRVCRRIERIGDFPLPRAGTESSESLA